MIADKTIGKLKKKKKPKIIWLTPSRTKIGFWGTHTYNSKKKKKKVITIIWYASVHVKKDWKKPSFPLNAKTISYKWSRQRVSIFHPLLSSLLVLHIPKVSKQLKMTTRVAAIMTRVLRKSLYVAVIFLNTTYSIV